MGNQWAINGQSMGNQWDNQCPNNAYDSRGIG
jgi:hypothetical protein